LFKVKIYEAPCIQPGGFVKNLVYLGKSKEDAERYFSSQTGNITSKIKFQLFKSMDLNAGIIKGPIIYSFCRQLAGIRDATGLNITESLKIIRHELHPMIQYLLPLLIDHIEKGGKPFYQALQLIHFTKDEAFFFAIKAGEESGTLSEVLRSYADINESIDESFENTFKGIRSSITNILFLPISLILVATIGRWMIESTAKNTNAPVPLILQIILDIPTYFLIAFIIALATLGYYLLNQILTQKQNKSSLPDLIENILLTNIFTKNFKTAQHNLDDLVSIRAMIQGKETFIGIMKFLSNRKEIKGYHKQAWIGANKKIIAGQEPKTVFGDPYFTKMFQSYLIRINNSTEKDRLLVIDEALKSQIDEVKISTQKMEDRVSNIGMTCFLIGTILFVAGIYLPPFIQSGEALLK